MLVLRGLQNSNSLVVLGGLALCLLFMIQIKQIYNNNQKYNRYLNYKQYVRLPCIYININNRCVVNIFNLFRKVILKIRKIFDHTDEWNSNGIEDSSEIHQQIIGLCPSIKWDAYQVSWKRVEEYLNVKSYFAVVNTLEI